MLIRSMNHQSTGEAVALARPRNQNGAGEQQAQASQPGRKPLAPRDRNGPTASEAVHGEPVGTGPAAPARFVCTHSGCEFDAHSGRFVRLRCSGAREGDRRTRTSRSRTPRTASRSTASAISPWTSPPMRRGLCSPRARAAGRATRLTAGAATAARGPRPARCVNTARKLIQSLSTFSDFVRLTVQRKCPLALVAARR